MILVVITLIIIGIVILTSLTIIILRKNIIQTHLDRYIDFNGTGSIHIPKNIYQLVSDKKNISPKFVKNIQFLKDLNPGWNHILMDDTDMIAYLQKYCPQSIITAYNSINPKYGAARADLFRYILIYLEGGVYFDIKSICKFPLDFILKKDDEYILSHWACKESTKYVDIIEGEFQQWYIISKPRHPFLLTVIKLVLQNIRNYTPSIGVGKMAVLKTTGPIAYTNAIIPLLDIYKNRVIEINEYIGLVYNNNKNISSSSHKKLFSKPHYSKIQEPLILPLNIND